MVERAHPDGSHEGFLQRWARRKEESVRGSEDAAPPHAAASSDGSQTPSRASARAPVPALDGEHARVPTYEGADVRVAASPASPLTSADVAALAADANYAPFMARDVDTAVRRLAMKKLFSDPHFKMLDGLDIYMGDYNVPSPVSAGMLAGLQHAQGMLARGTELAERATVADRTALAATTTTARAVPDADAAAASAGAAVQPPVSEGDA